VVWELNAEKGLITLEITTFRSNEIGTDVVLNVTEFEVLLVGAIEDPPPKVAEVLLLIVTPVGKVKVMVDLADVSVKLINQV
jgi:hypothetical protein